MEVKKTRIISPNYSKNEPHIILPTILLNSGRQEFRKQFIKTFPGFIHHLRNLVPDITESEEILCMLIMLKQSTTDIAAILSISRKSVIQSRYRLSLKIGMITKYHTLENFIHNIPL